MDVSGKLIVITDGESGMGLEMAKIFAQDGAQVVITCHTESELDAAATQHENITPFFFDNSDEDEDIIKIRYAMEKKGVQFEDVEIIDVNAVLGGAIQWR